MSDEAVKEYKVFEAAAAPYRGNAYVNNRLLITEGVDYCMDEAAKAAAIYASQHPGEEVRLRAGDTEVTVTSGQTASELKQAWYAQEKIDFEQAQAAPEATETRVAARR